MKFVFNTMALLFILAPNGNAQNEPTANVLQPAENFSEYNQLAEFLGLDRDHDRRPPHHRPPEHRPPYGRPPRPYPPPNYTIECFARDQFGGYYEGYAYDSYRAQRLAMNQCLYYSTGCEPAGCRYR